MDVQDILGSGNLDLFIEMTSRWRPKNRRQILQLNDEDPQTLPAAMPTSPAPNKLHALLGHYNSDDEESETEADDQFKDFMNEIKTAETETAAETSVWQELWDPQSGQPYYWNTISNELTWDKPQDLIKPIATKNGNESKTASKAEVVTKSEKKESKTEISSVSTEPGKSTANSRSGINHQSSSNQKEEEKGEAKITEPSSIIKKEETKISFKLLDRSSSSALNCSRLLSESSLTKTNGKPALNADTIIAAIEKEVPPDYKSEVFVPLFRRRPLENTGKPKLGVNFKTYFQPKYEPILQDPDSADATPLVIINTHRGLGYQDKENEAPSANQKEEVHFVAGEILKPLVVEPEPVVLTLQEKILRLERHLDDDLPDGLLKTQVTAQLSVLKEAWGLKKLESDYLDTWLENFEAKWAEESTVVNVEDQVIDMVIEDSGSENPGTPCNPSEELLETNNAVEECLDSALNSFYTDLATLDTNEPEPISVPSPVPTPAPVAVIPDVTKASESETVDEASGDPIKGIKRSKMSQDMTSLVAKWQKIHKANT